MWTYPGLLLTLIDDYLLLRRQDMGYQHGEDFKREAVRLALSVTWTNQRDIGFGLYSFSLSAS